MPTTLNMAVAKYLRAGKRKSLTSSDFTTKISFVAVRVVPPELPP
jgi:hypothetical protein